MGLSSLGREPKSTHSPSPSGEIQTPTLMADCVLVSAALLTLVSLSLSQGGGQDKALPRAAGGTDCGFGHLRV